MKEIFGKKGCLKDILSCYEERPEQLKMAEFISEFLTESGGNLLIEAGTGTGKTMAYLVPALVHAKNEGLKLAVSTETKALQKQLLDKDLPLVKKILKENYNLKVKASLCLGSSNYPCRRKFEQVIARGNFLFDEKFQVEVVKDLFSGNKTFSRYDVKVSNELWKEIARESEICPAFNCPMFNKCVFQKVKKEWAVSDLLIMNHYLYFSNIALGKAYLPYFDITVFDEAHSVETIASKQLGFELTSEYFEDLLQRFHLNKKRSLLGKIKDITLRQQTIESLVELKKAAKGFFDETGKYFLGNSSNNLSLRLKSGLSFGTELAELLKYFLSLIKDAPSQINDELLKAEFEGSRARLFEYFQYLNMIVFGHEQDWVYWIEKSYAGKKKNDDYLFKGQPLNIAEIMRNDVYSFYYATIFVSATLSVNKDFFYITKSLGITDPRALILDSPFDYKSNVLIYLPEKLSPPTGNNYITEAAGYSVKIIEKLEGRCLVLFTSYNMLNQFKEILRQRVEYPVIAQGEMGPVEAISAYLDEPDAVLLGTHSFWQGLDLPGDLLRGIIITRLPFFVPDRPDYEAKLERCQKEGLNSFATLQIPGAVIKFKQGFGRLIRSGSDRGIVTVLDKRITRSSYGKIFLNSLPECKVSSDFKDVLEFKL